MASDVDICNLSLARLGDDATVSSIDPPEGSAQAAHCARFYPIARDSLLEEHPWGFATRRIALALLTQTPPSEWAFTYQVPSDQLNILAVTAPDASDDYTTGMPPPYSRPGSPNTAIGYGLYTPQPYVTESLPDGTDVLYTNQQNAVLRYTVLITDTTKFSPLFVDTLSWRLAGMLAGPVLKGEIGRDAAKDCNAMAMGMLSKATVSDANQRRTDVAHNVSWISNR